MKVFNDNQIDLLEALAKEYNVLIVTDRFGVFSPEVYVVTDYRYYTDKNPYISFAGWKKITRVIADNSTYSNSPNILRTVITQIDSGIAATSKQREFDNHQFSFIKF